MRWFANLSTRSKLALGFGFVIGCFAVVLVTAFFSLQAVRDAEHSVVEMSELRSKMNGQRASLFAALLLPPGKDREKRIKEALQFSAESEAPIQWLRTHYENHPEAARPIREWFALRDEFNRTRDDQLIPLIREDKVEEAKVIALGAQEIRYLKIRAIAREFTRWFNDRSTAQRQRAQTIFWLLGGFSLAAAVGMVVGLTRLIARPLERVTAVADRIAHGEIEAESWPAHRTDEVGSLTQAFDRMTQALRAVADGARQIAAGDLTSRLRPQSDKDTLGAAFAMMTDNLAGMTRELIEAVNVLVASSTEIMTATAQLAGTARETAAAVAQTTTTVDEVRQTSQISSHKAKVVADQAQKAVDISRSGKHTISQTIEGMNGVRQQMRTVAESILSLSTQGQAIGEIIATVDDLAAQSKLLAVNASIEASKAGEEGKGFSVVAKEVRKLAEQSKQATTQVRGILNEIQKATSNAVLATEVATKAVEAGVQQSAAAGESIGALAENVGEAVQAATQIAATSQQQFVGMDQVATAMENIKQASTQTVASTRQAEAAAQQLHGLGQKLKQVIERFKV